MSKVSWSARIRHDSDAVFREWGSDLSARLLAAGLVQTADTGQINWTTVTRGGTNTDLGYEIWRFDDTLQATAPIFIRIYYGTGGGSSSPRWRFAIGTGTDGAGTLTGTTSSIHVASSTSTAATTDTARNSYLNWDSTQGALLIAFKLQATGNSEGFMAICRTVDASGAPTATGALLVGLSSQNGLLAQSIRFASTAAVYTQRTTAASAQLCLWTMSPASSVVGSDTQAALAFTLTPRIEPINQICGVLDAEVTDGNDFTATLIGSTAHVYKAVCADRNFMDASGSLKPAMLWD